MTILTNKNFDFEQKEALVKCIVAFSNSSLKADEIFDKIFSDNGKNLFRSNANSVFKTFLRNSIAIDLILSQLCKKKPRSSLLAALKAACADLISRSKDFQAVDSWVEFIKVKFSKREAGFINAVLRKFNDAFAKVSMLAYSNPSVENLSVAFSHPSFIVSKWISQFGIQKTIQILKVNQTPSSVFLRSNGSDIAKKLLSQFADSLSSTSFENFFALKSGRWPDAKSLLDSGLFYIQDPSTSFAPSLLAPKFGDKVLDLCAAPGGKSRFCADLILQSADFDKSKSSSSLIVSVDLPGKRMLNLQENLKKIDFLKTILVALDFSQNSLVETLRNLSLPEKFDCVLLDAPCSNSGVLRRRPDARFNLSADFINANVSLQKVLVRKAAELVEVGGKLVYSTCSIENEENIEVVEEFLKEFPNFKLLASKISLPDFSNDGEGAFCFERI